MKDEREDNDYTSKQNCACDGRIERNWPRDGSWRLQRLGRTSWFTMAARRTEAESLVAEIRRKGGRADAISADLGTPDGAALLAEQVRSIVGDRLDVLVLNAGISKSARIADHTVEDFDNLFATNVRGPFFLVQQLLPILGEGSSIVAISSLGARTVRGQARLGKPFAFLPTPLPKEHLRRWSRTGPRFSDRAAYA